MPRWGLTAEMKSSGAWRIPAQLLEPAKVITDPVHGDIYLTELERRIVDSRPFQRLRRVRQLGTTHLVYPDAVHTRFAHSLGAMRAAQDLVDIVIDQRNTGPRAVGDLFGEWSDRYDRDEFLQRCAEATILTR